jgi:2-polyprenyl-3-methyl-5-hydroxy-6-metoxy-1,4-benzoquinol methylase
MRRMRRLMRGVMTVASRRGLKYFGYLLTGVVIPRGMYRLVWGPRAPAITRRLFNASAIFDTRTPTAEELRQWGLLAGDDRSVPARNVAPANVVGLMNRAHASGVTGVAASFDDIVVVDGRLAFARLPHARVARMRSARHRAGRDADRQAFNQRFGATLLTEEGARQALGALKARLPAGYRDYAPIDFGGGLFFGQIASTDSGTGRWDYFNHSIVAPLVEGQRVLDLGCNNGSLSLMMARAGAREVVGIEMSPEIAEFARLNAEILSWRDQHPYKIAIRTGDMRVFLEEDLGTFDVVTAFCSLYYLPERDMAAIIAKAAATGATLILQANEGIGSNCPGTRRDLERLITQNGYPDAQVHAPAGFARPMLVGQVDAQLRKTANPRFAHELANHRWAVEARLDRL